MTPQTHDPQFGEKHRTGPSPPTYDPALHGPLPMTPQTDRPEPDAQGSIYGLWVAVEGLKAERNQLAQEIERLRSLLVEWLAAHNMEPIPGWDDPADWPGWDDLAERVTQALSTEGTEEWL